MNYPELIAALPLPTREQTAAFAEHVANVHSWYKHLPVFPPGATFTFFLNPRACEHVERDGAGYAVRPIEQGDYFRHGSRLSTAQYRQRFGHWDYWVNNPRSYRYTEGGTPEGPFLYGVGPTGRAPLPSELVRGWSCRLTAFLKLNPVIREADEQAFAEYARARPTDPDVERYRDAARQGQAFANSEVFVQRQLVLQTLLMVRDELTRMRAE